MPSGGIFSYYCGPWNDYLGVPRHAVDRLCREHDMLYDRYIASGLNPYTAFNRGDKKFLDALTEIVPESYREQLVKTAAQIYFNGKELVVPNLDYTGLRGTDVNPRDRVISMEVDYRGRSFPNLPDSEQMVDRPEKKRKFAGDNVPASEEESPVVMESMSLTSDSRNNAYGKGRETQLVPLPRKITVGLPEYFTTKHRGFNRSTWNWSADLSETNSGNDIGVRGNSVYDAGWPNLGTFSWYNFYKSVYQQVCTISMEYKFTFTNYSSSDFYVHFRTYGETKPAFGVNTVDLMQDPTMERILVPYDGTRRAVVSKGGFLTHKDYEANIQEVAQDSKDNLWTAVDTAPALSHYLYVMPRRKNVTLLPPATNEKILVEFEVIYTCQWRDMRAEYKFQYTGDSVKD